MSINDGIYLLSTWGKSEIISVNNDIAPFLRINVVDQYADSRYCHFRIQVFQPLNDGSGLGHWEDIIVLGGETRMHDAIKTAKGLYAMYQRGREEVKSKVRASIET